MANDKIPFGGRDWNHDGKYDNFDRMTDFYVYKKVKEDWKKNGAWDKPRKQNPIKQHQEPSQENMRFVNVFGGILIFVLMIFAFSQDLLLSGSIFFCVLIYLLYSIFKEDESN